ncbi:MAG: hypothetical protein K2P78_02410 [Gemmataceae bacterium]|nr:hypothetical protein [Gemmataceae bacterium]
MARTTAAALPPAPQRQPPANTWPHYALYERVRDALLAIPTHFRTETYIAGVMATDLHTLNTVLGATIEEQAVATLNAMRSLWDPDDAYALYSFVRQPQTFPDVLLRKAPDGDIILGVELKGWYLLSAEEEPSYRYKATPAVCAPPDLLVVVPWALSSVLAGKPTVFTPHVELARYAAEARNHYWRHTRNVRDATRSRDITHPAGVAPYPQTKAERISDVPAYDGCRNFGRLARSGIADMDAYFTRMLQIPLCGVRVEHWLKFLKAIGGSKSEAEIRAEVESLVEELEPSTPPDPKHESVRSILGELRKLAELPPAEE